MVRSLITEIVNPRVYAWLREEHLHGAFPSNEMIKVKALDVACEELGFVGFKASNYWLAAFRRQYGMRRYKLSELQD